MSSLDLAIVTAYLVGTMLLSAWLARSNASADDYYVGGRSMPWWALALSTMATQSSANSFIGIPAFVALVPGGGLTWLQYELAVPLAILVVMRPGASPMDITGRPMRGFLWVNAANAAGSALHQRIVLAEEFVGDLPPK